MNYQITQKQLSCINILLKVLQEAINREAFSEKEKEKIYKTVEMLTDIRKD
tara:strand:+ start:337 stop:489 length:153 start_codon:yes stop_codon:yes gene_type:complete